MNTHEIYMYRCIELARKGAGSVAPNPMVGAVLVHGERIIGEGYHKEYRKAHAEVNCINSVTAMDQSLIPDATLYVSLEPCAHFGKTPPCSDLIIQKGIKKTVIGCRDPFTEVDGKGIEKLQQAGVETITGVLEKKCRELNKRFLTGVLKKRPYIILKWAQTSNQMIAAATGERLLISNEYTNRLVHLWRSEEAAILVGTNTALFDDPSLNNRLWSKKNAVRLVLDRTLRLPSSLQIFDRTQKTIVLNTVQQKERENLLYERVDANKNIIHEICDACYRLQIESILVEGGAQLLQSFIDANFWDEARIITNTQLSISDGLKAPSLTNHIVSQQEKVATDTILYYNNATHL